jgi:hypothetical protein
VQFQVEIAHRQDRNYQNDSHHDHQDIRFAGCRDEGGQMVRSYRMKLIAQMFLHVSVRRTRRAAPNYPGSLG